MNTEDQLPSFIPSTYHVLTPLDNAFHSNINNQEQRIMINRIMSILNDRLDDAQQCKDSFNQNSMQPILFDVLREIKQRHGRENIKN
jgi:hypothetical protein